MQHSCLPLVTVHPHKTVGHPALTNVSGTHSYRKFLFTIHAVDPAAFCTTRTRINYAAQRTVWQLVLHVV